MASLFEPDRSVLVASGYESVGHVPFLLSAGLEYLDEPNRFLRERATGAWHPNRREQSPYGRALRPSENTIRAYGRDLENALTYFETRKLDWRTIDYQQLLDTYDADMGTGRCSADGSGLGNSTINRRVDTLVEFLLWSGDRGFRRPFSVATELAPRNGSLRGAPAGRKRVKAEVRIGRRRVHSRHLRLPTGAEIHTWLSEIETRLVERDRDPAR